MREFSIIDAADQKFSTVMNGQRVTLRFRYNVSTDRWSFDLSLDDLPILHGVRVVLNTDLFAGYDLDLGVLIAIPITPYVQPDRQALPMGNVRLYHMTTAEAAELEEQAEALA